MSEWMFVWMVEWMDDGMAGWLYKNYNIECIGRRYRLNLWRLLLLLAATADIAATY